MKLHLGCGERYLPGYQNIDYPPTEHTIQTKSVADQHANLLELHYSQGSIEEVRLHHVFEHFSRPIAFAMLAAWSDWLKVDGILHIEVPDLQKSAWDIINPFNKKYLVSTRHLFGSHEAHWAIHCEGWSKKSFSFALKALGYGDLVFKKTTWSGIHNLEVIARKKPGLSKEQKIQSVDRVLREYLIDHTETEQKIHSVWMELFKAQYKKLSHD